jgi:uncharacterized membrane protein
MTSRQSRFGRLLSAGVLLSAACLLVGLALTMLDRALGPEHAGPHPLLHVGLLMLIATPMLRVIVALVEDVRERNWFFATATAVVLGVLAGALFVAWRALR